MNGDNRNNAALLQQAAEILEAAAQDRYPPATRHDLADYVENWGEALQEDGAVLEAAAEIMDDFIGPRDNPAPDITDEDIMRGPPHRRNPAKSLRALADRIYPPPPPPEAHPQPLAENRELLEAINEEAGR